MQNWQKLTELRLKFITFQFNKVLFFKLNNKIRSLLFHDLIDFFNGFDHNVQFKQQRKARFLDT
jgi:hypothetical protein